jgi:hypothetical protein
MTGRSLPYVYVCVPTFRRPDGLRKLLAHFERLNYASRVEVIVVDNDAETGAGAAIVEQVSRTFRFPISCVVEPRRLRPQIMWPLSMTTNSPIRTGSPK